SRAVRVRGTYLARFAVVAEEVINSMSYRSGHLQAGATAAGSRGSFLALVIANDLIGHHDITQPDRLVNAPGDAGHRDYGWRIGLAEPIEGDARRQLARLQRPSRHDLYMLSRRVDGRLFETQAVTVLPLPVRARPG